MKERISAFLYSAYGIRDNAANTVARIQDGTSRVRFFTGHKKCISSPKRPRDKHDHLSMSTVSSYPTVNRSRSDTYNWPPSKDDIKMIGDTYEHTPTRKLLRRSVQRDVYSLTFRRQVAVLLGRQNTTAITRLGACHLKISASL